MNGIKQLKLLVLFALCNVTYSFFNTKPVLLKKYTNYRLTKFPLKCNNNNEQCNELNVNNVSGNINNNVTSTTNVTTNVTNVTSVTTNVTSVTSVTSVTNVTNVTSVPMLRPKPIPVITFDELFLNWNIVNRIFLSANRDRIILLYGNDKKGVYYIDYDQLKKIEYMISLTSASVSIEPVCNLDNPWFHLYCSPPSSYKIKEMNFSIFNTSHENSNEDENDKDDYNDNYGFGFGIGM